MMIVVLGGMWHHSSFPPHSGKKRKLCEPHTCSNPSISQDLAKMLYLLTSKSIHNWIGNDPSKAMKDTPTRTTKHG